jgi:hypothetical protein
MHDRSRLRLAVSTRSAESRPPLSLLRACDRRAVAWILPLSLSAALLGEGCASMKGYHAEPLPDTPVEKTQRTGDPDVELSIKKLSPQAVLRVLGAQAEWLARRATVLDVGISAGPFPVPVSQDSFRLRLPGGEAQPLETKWVLATMHLPKTGTGRGSSGSGGGSSGSGNWPPEGAIDIKSPEEAVFWLGLIPPIALANAISQALRESKETYAERVTADVRAKTILPRIVEPGTSVELLLVFVTRTGAILNEGRAPLEVRFELERCTWQSELEIPAR